MAMNTTTLSDTVKTMYETRLLSRAVPRYIHGKFATMARLNKFGSYEVRKFNSVPLVSNALTQGNTPAEGSAPEITKVVFTPQWFGSWLSYTDQLDLQNFDPVISETSGILGEQAGVSFDTLLRTTLTDGATVDYSGDATARTGLETSGDKISFADFIGTLAALQNQNAMPADGGSIPVIMGPFTWAQLMQDSTFVTLFTREGGEAIRSGRMGTILNCTIYVTSNARTYVDGGAANADVMSCLFIGQESFGIAGMSGVMPEIPTGDSGGEMSNNTGKPVSPVEIIVKDLGETGLDPLNQRGTIGWKATHDAKILNSSWIFNLEHVTMYS